MATNPREQSDKARPVERQSFNASAAAWQPPGSMERPVLAQADAAPHRCKTPIRAPFRPAIASRGFLSLIRPDAPTVALITPLMPLNTPAPLPSNGDHPVQLYSPRPSLAHP